MVLDFDEKAVMAQIEADLNFDTNEVDSYASKPDYADVEGASAGFTQDAQAAAGVQTGEAILSAKNLFELKAALKSSIYNNEARFYRHNKETQYLNNRIDELSDRIQLLESYVAKPKGVRM